MCYAYKCSPVQTPSRSPLGSQSVAYPTGGAREELENSRMWTVFPSQISVITAVIE